MKKVEKTGLLSSSGAGRVTLATVEHGCRVAPQETRGGSDFSRLRLPVQSGCVVFHGGKIGIDGSRPASPTSTK